MLWDPHTISLPAQFITCDVMSERLTEQIVQFSQGYTPAVSLCKSFYFSAINCAVSQVNRTASSVRTLSKWGVPQENLRELNQLKVPPGGLVLRILVFSYILENLSEIMLFWLKETTVAAETQDNIDLKLPEKNATGWNAATTSTVQSNPFNYYF